MAPETLGGRGVRTAPRLADHFEPVCIAVKVVPILLLGVFIYLFIKIPQGLWGALHEGT